jgi:hypothetical protein
LSHFTGLLVEEIARVSVTLGTFKRIGLTGQATSDFTESDVASDGTSTEAFSDVTNVDADFFEKVVLVVIVAFVAN